MQVDIRQLLIDRIRELRKDKADALSPVRINQIEDILALNIKLYYYIFQGSV